MRRFVLAGLGTIFFVAVLLFFAYNFTGFAGGANYILAGIVFAAFYESWRRKHPA